MTIKNDNRREGYTGLGTLDTYGYGWKIFRATDLSIKERIIATEAGFSIGDEIIQTVGAVGSGADYEVSGVKNPTGSVVRADGNLPTTRFLSIILSPAFLQDTSIRNQKAGLRGRIEDELDRSRQIDLFLLDILQRCLKVGETIDPAVVNTTMPTPEALKFWRWNANANGIDSVDIGSLGAIGLPGGNGIAVYLGSNNFTNRILVGTNGISVSDDDGVSGNPTISGATLETNIATNASDIVDLQTEDALTALPYIATEQDTPDDTVKLGPAQVHSLADPTKAAVDVAAGAADALTHASTTSGKSRIDLLIGNNDTGVVTQTAGVDDASPTVPAYPTDINLDVICEVTITDTGTVTINDADIRYVMKRTPPVHTILGRPVLIGEINANGTIAVNEDDGAGGSFSIVRNGAGDYDATITGVASGTYRIVAQIHGVAVVMFEAVVTDKGLGTGSGTNTGFTVLLFKISGGVPVAQDAIWSFKMERVA